jgi:hypothetical protein
MQKRAAIYVRGVQCAIYLNIGEHRIYFGEVPEPIIDLRTWTAGGNRMGLNPDPPCRDGRKSD